MDWTVAGEPVPLSDADPWRPAGPAVPLQQPRGGMFDAPPPTDPFERGALKTRSAVTSRMPDALVPPSPEIDDYSTGAPMSVRIDLSRMDNPAEATLLMNKRYGVNNSGQDEYGNWWFMDPASGKRVAVFPKGSLYEGSKNVAAGMAATTPAMAGSVAGAATGAAIGAGAAGVGAIPGGIIGAMVGGAGGKGVDELVKAGGGLFDKSPAETAGTLGNEAAMAGAFQGAQPAWRATAPARQNLARWWTGVTPQSAHMGSDLLGGGVRPPIASIAPDAKTLEYKRGLRNITAGDPVEPERFAYINDRVRNMMRSSGFDDAQIDTAIQQIQDKSSKVSSREADELVVGKVRETQQGLLKEERTEMAKAEGMLANLQSSVQAWAKAPVDLADKVAGAIRVDKKSFNDTMGNVYRTVDRMLGDQAIVPTDLIRREAREIIDVMDPSAVPPILKRWASEIAPETLTFEQAHALRTTFREMAESFDVSPIGQKLNNLSRVAKAVDDSIKLPIIELKPAAEALARADRIYGYGINHFTDATLNKLVTMTRSGLTPPPGDVAEVLLRAENPTTVRRVWGVLDDVTKEDVAKADLSNVLKQAATVNKEGATVIDGRALLDVLQSRGEVMSILHGKRQMDWLTDFAKTFAAYDGKLDVNALSGSGVFADVKLSLEKALGARRATDEYARKNPRIALSSNEPDMVDSAARTILGGEARTEAAYALFKPGSTEWQAVEKYALQRLLNEAFVTTPSLGRRVSGPAIEQALSRYTPKQQELLFGRGVKEDLRLLSQEAKFLFPHDVSDLGTSLAGAATLGKMPSLAGIRRYGWQLLAGFISDNPKVLKFLADEIRHDRPQARTTMSIIRQSIINSAVSGPGTRFPEAPEPPPMMPEQPLAETQPSYGGPQ